MEYVYLLKLLQHIDNGEDVYKIGKTTQRLHERLSGYPKGSEFYLALKVKNCHNTELELKRFFRQTYKHRKDHGDEYFEGDPNQMIQDIIEIGISCDFKSNKKNPPLKKKEEEEIKQISSLQELYENTGIRELVILDDSGMGTFIKNEETHVFRNVNDLETLLYKELKSGNFKLSEKLAADIISQCCYPFVRSNYNVDSEKTYRAAHEWCKICGSNNWVFETPNIPELKACVYFITIIDDKRFLTIIPENIGFLEYIKMINIIRWEDAFIILREDNWIAGDAKTPILKKASIDNSYNNPSLKLENCDMTMREAILLILDDKIPRTVKSIWNEIDKKQLIVTTGKTPERTANAACQLLAKQKIIMQNNKISPYEYAKI